MDFSAFPSLSVRPADVDGVWTVRLPKLPWKMASAEQQQRSIIKTLGNDHPNWALFLSDADSDSGWHLLAGSDDLSRWEEKLARGAWALFFFRDPPNKSLDTVLPASPDTPAAAVAFARSLGAGAAIWSWFDDIEWLLAVPPPPAAS